MFIFHSKSGAGSIAKGGTCSGPTRGPITRSKTSSSSETTDPLITGGGAQVGGPLTRSKSKSSSEIR